MWRKNGAVGTIASDDATHNRPTYIQVVSSTAGPINLAYSRNREGTDCCRRSVH